MKVATQHYHTIWPDARCKFVEIIDQTKLPFAFEIVRIENLTQMRKEKYKIGAARRLINCSARRAHQFFFLCVLRGFAVKFLTTYKP